MQSPLIIDVSIPSEDRHDDVAFSFFWHVLLSRFEYTHESSL